MITCRDFEALAVRRPHLCTWSTVVVLRIHIARPLLALRCLTCAMVSLIADANAQTGERHTGCQDKLHIDTVTKIKQNAAYYERLSIAARRTAVGRKRASPPMSGRVT